MILSARDAYTMWAPHYSAETAVSALEDRTVAELGVRTAGRRVVDVGCGSARRLMRLVDGAADRATLAIGVDVTTRMLGEAPPAIRRAVAGGDVRALPIASEAFDVVWCRLVIGHLRELDAAYAELARVCARGGRIVITDFHPDAVAAGHRRTFRGEDGVVREIEHHVHSPAAHARAAALAGLSLHARRDGRVNERIRSFYAGREAAFDAQYGLALVLALAYARA